MLRGTSREVYSVQHDLPYPGVMNRAGQLPLPTLESITAAARAVADQVKLEMGYASGLPRP